MGSSRCTGRIQGDAGRDRRNVEILLPVSTLVWFGTAVFRCQREVKAALLFAK